MIKEYYEDYVVNKHYPTYEEIQIAVNFFATFAVGCLQYGMEDLGQVMGNRLTAYISLLRKIGWKSSIYRAGYKTFGLESILGGALSVQLEGVAHKSGPF